jgi:diketogulonate reductase-like aldo/keto reductase
MKEVTLNNGRRMPAIGFGVFQMTPEVCEESVLKALSYGYRLIDTANAYMNERAVGRAMKKSGLSREEIFLTTKIMPCDFGYEQTLKAIDETLARLNTDYIDLLLLHIRFGDYMGAWRALEKAVKDGTVRNIGVSNFEEEQLNDILQNGTIVPQVDQIECHPYFQEKAIRKLLEQYDIRVESYYPVGHGDKRLLEETVIKSLAAKYGKTPVQIILRWHIQEGFVPLPKSTNPDHIKLNLDVFDFSLTDEDMSKMSLLDTNRSYFQDYYDKVSEEEHAAMFLNQPHPDYNAQK